MVIIIAVERPKLSPSPVRYIIPKLLPPTVDGVTADVNSQSMLTRSACPQVMSWSVSVRKRHVRPKSRPAMKSRASRKYPIDVVEI